MIFVKMNFYNNKLTKKINNWIRIKIIIPRKRKFLKNKNISILCNNCTGGFIYHDLGLQFKSPTINMFFHSLDFFDFIEHFDYYIKQPLIKIDNTRYDENSFDYPVAQLSGNKIYKDLELHFLHYKTFEEANEKWEKRKQRISLDNLFVIWTFAGIPPDDKIYERAQNLPFENKVIFVNHAVNKDKFPSFYYIKGFENEKGLGLLGSYSNLMGKRYYDQFDYVKWFNTGEL